ncbi:LysR substrate-binding domain-containing protein [Tahibacter amnicola]|uniref:LysR substrate-binding domain-containing protein n=1 Tax=Tahibacter amnicola TaxID=2976241 RepID=UPI0031BAC159
MRDLNDLAYFVAVVDHGGFAAAGRALGMPKSRLSRRIAQLEEDLGVRLLQRSTRRFAVTDVGQEVVRHSRAMLAQAQAAEEAVDVQRAAPRGLVRLSCPVEPAQSILAPLLPEFLAAYPQVQLQMIVSNRRVDVIGEGIDVALRVRPQLDTDAELVIRTLGQKRGHLVASPGYLTKHGRPAHPSDLQGHASLSMIEHDAVQTWTLVGPDGETAKIDHEPRLRCGDFNVLLASALAGQGIVLLPEIVCAAELARGELERVVPLWRPPEGIFHIVYASRRGLLPSVRALIDFLVERVPPVVTERRRECDEREADLASPASA